MTGTLKSNKLVFLVIALLMGVVFIGSLTFLKNIYQTEDYYVLNTDVPTRSQLYPEMFDKMTTSEGTAPPGALRPADVQAGGVYTRYPLRAGEIVTLSNTGGLDDISIGIPDSFIVTSFSVGADDAVGGRITRGYYFDMMLVTDQGVMYPFVNLLTLDTSVSLSGASNANAVNTEEAKMGQTSIYYVGMSPEDAAYLQDLVRQYSGSIKLVMSPRENEYQAPNLNAYSGMFQFDARSWDTKDASPGTNNTFTDVERDEMGRPLDRDDNGNVNYTIRCGNSQGTAVNDLSECEIINNNSFGGGSSTGGGNASNNNAEPQDEPNDPVGIDPLNDIVSD